MYTFLAADIDECDDEVAECKDGTYCDNTPGSYKCKGEIIQSGQFVTTGFLTEPRPLSTLHNILIHVFRYISSKVIIKIATMVLYRQSTDSVQQSVYIYTSTAYLFKLKVEKERGRGS